MRDRAPEQAFRRGRAGRHRGQPWGRGAVVRGLFVGALSRNGAKRGSTALRSSASITRTEIEPSETGVALVVALTVIACSVPVVESAELPLAIIFSSISFVLLCWPEWPRAVQLRRPLWHESPKPCGPFGPCCNAPPYTCDPICVLSLADLQKMTRPGIPPHAHASARVCRGPDQCLRIRLSSSTLCRRITSSVSAVRLGPC